MYKWHPDQGLIVIISWVDDLLIAGKAAAIAETKEALLTHFECDNVGVMTEYVGCKVECNNNDSIKLTQPVLLQSFVDEFDLSKVGSAVTPAPQGEKLRVAEQGTEGDDAMQTVYRSGVGKLLHLTRWSRPDIRMAVQSLTRFGGRAGDKHLKAMHTVMQYCINTQYRGRKIKPNRLYQGDESTVHFKVAGRSDSDFASDEETRRSITGAAATFEGVSVGEKCKLQAR
jgi:Reverse transcriptase (RNA-dependent DNA polymerase)